MAEACCRVYLFTYKRNNLLSRAVKSLTGQTFRDWVCEVHNDDPQDIFPQQYINSLNDPRFTVHNHTQNMGAVASFNLAFAGCSEKYATMLEDDNWWEPDFLKEAVNLMNGNPTLKVAWSNMHLWQENANDTWTDTGNTTWPVKEGTTYFSWPAPKQIMGALHSNGAMIYRVDLARNYIIPGNALFNAVELIRERSFEHPLCLINKPLANFAITKATHRSNDPYPWIANQIMLVASFVSTAKQKKEAFKLGLQYSRKQKPSPVPNLFLANLLILKDKNLYAFFSFKDWFIILKWLLSNGNKLSKLRTYLFEQKNVYAFLLENTRKRQNESSL